MSVDTTSEDPIEISTKTCGDKRKYSSTGIIKGGYDVPWVEKYRPRTLDEVVGNHETLVRLRAIARDGNMPNLILCGPPGTGKTSSVHALARGMLGDAYDRGVLELNASDARGIDVVRGKIKSFAMNKVHLPHGRHKIIILDEADSMTSAAQQALRRTMEIYSNTTRFALACNISTKIIEPIQSRAAILRYSRLADEQILVRLRHVCACEDVSHDDDGLEAILFCAEGDMRHALNGLQASHSGFGHVGRDQVFKVCDRPHPGIVRTIVDACINGGDTSTAVSGMQGLWDAGYAGTDIIGTLFRVVRNHGEMPEALKLEYLREIGFGHMRLADGADSLLQLLGLVSRLCQKVEVDDQ